MKRFLSLFSAIVIALNAGLAVANAVDGLAGRAGINAFLVVMLLYFAIDDHVSRGRP